VRFLTIEVVRTRLLVAVGWQVVRVPPRPWVVSGAGGVALEVDGGRGGRWW
jgi:hypothetical protein